MNNNRIGEFGEKTAEKYLIKKGYSILKNNHREKFYEIDIIAKKPDKTIIFCEVKTTNIHNSTYFSQFSPEDKLDLRKYKKIATASKIFVAKYPELIDEDRGWQIDMIAVSIIEGRCIDIRHYENI